jgi:predicted ATPase
MGEALARHDEILRSAIDAQNGYVFSTGGDGLAAVFSRADSAVAAAAEAQRAFGVEPWPEEVPLLVRMGVHTGEVQERDGDYFGPPVNRAARLMGAANGGQLVISALTAELLDGSDDIELVDLGSVQLKGVVDPVHVFGVSADGLDWVDRPLVTAQTTAGNLPRLQTEMVGDLAGLQSRVSRLAQTRLVTLTGSGGVGKTRVAIEIGWLVVDEFPDGVWFVELGPIADPEAVIAAVASTLSIQPQAGVSVVESIVDWCLGRRMLLIIDNCEHVLDPIIELVSAVVAGCPTVTIVATSREPLGLAGEQVERIPSLSVDDGVELFIARAAAADASFGPSPTDSEAIAAICARVDGIPLAIELAAARIRSLSPAELLDRLDDRFRLLRGGGRGGLERHQTLRAAVAWSYQLLSDIDRLLFDRLSVFAGGFDAGAAEAVCAGDGVDEEEIIDVLGELVDKSMVIAQRVGPTTRYRLLETLRQYGEERLDERQTTSELRDRHLRYYQNLARQTQEQRRGPGELEAGTVFDHEWDNLRAAHGWSITIEDIAASDSLVSSTSLHAFQNLRHEHAEWTSRTMRVGEDDGVCGASIYGAAAVWAMNAADPDRGLELARRGIALHPNDPYIGQCHMMLVYGLLMSAQIDEATAAVPRLLDLLDRDPPVEVQYWLLLAATDALIQQRSAAPHLTQLLAVAHTAGQPTMLADARRQEGNVLLWSTDPPDFDGAEDAFRESLLLAETIRSKWTACMAHLGLAAVAVLDFWPDAATHLREALSRSYDARHWASVNLALEVCTLHLRHTAATQGAATILGHLELHPPAFAPIADIRRDSVEALTETPNAAEHRAKGAAMDRHEIVAYALTQLDDP